jgi:transposase InsO family protein
VEQRKHFVEEMMSGEVSMSELCRRFGVSRKTGYKWLRRFQETCELTDRSRRPHHSPRAVVQEVEDFIVRARKEWPRWGPRKLRAALARANPNAELPSVSTFALIFKRNGLVTPRRRRRGIPPSSVPMAHATYPNKLWCIDFKGDFVVGRTRCYPLTVTDAYSRYLLACVALPNTRTKGAIRVLQNVFRQFGLPERIRSDNGSPFAAAASPGGLSELSAWWHTLGICHERIDPGKPQQNGRHERMHWTLKLETALPPASSLLRQQRVFDRFRARYNEQRPHEALGNKVPADFYHPSTRLFPDPPWGPDHRYPSHFETIRINRTGFALWNGRAVFISSALRHRLLGIEWGENGCLKVLFGGLHLGSILKGGKRLRFESKPIVSPMSLD